MNLTAKQSEIVRFIWQYRKVNGIAPTLSEIADKLGVSKITVHEHIGLLEKKGAIKKEKYQSRSMTLSRAVVRELEAVDRERGRSGGAAVDPDVPIRESAVRASSNDGEVPTLPLLGRIAAGSPIEAIEGSDELDITSALRLDRADYALEVKGDSMIDDGIREGDIVLVERRSTARDGETVVAIVEGNEATLKRFYRDKEGYRLVPANARLQPFTVPKNKLEIRGVVVGVVRGY